MLTFSNFFYFIDNCYFNISGLRVELIENRLHRTLEPGIYYPKAAISASPLVPLVNNVTVWYGAYDAFNLTEVTGPIHIANSTVHKCRGLCLSEHT